MFYTIYVACPPETGLGEAFTGVGLPQSHEQEKGWVQTLKKLVEKWFGCSMRRLDVGSCYTTKVIVTTT